jgi:mono/diheme cytochrome c family protein
MANRRLAVVTAFLAAGIGGDALAADPKIVAFFEETCGACHGEKGQGTPGLAPPLKGSKFVIESAPADIAAVITNGRKKEQKHFPELLKAMPAHSLSETRLQGVVSYVQGEIQTQE